MFGGFTVLGLVHVAVDKLVFSGRWSYYRVIRFHCIVTCPSGPRHILHPIQPVYVMPSTSGRAATYPKRSDKLKFFHELKDLRDKMRGEKGRGTAVEEVCKPSTETSTEGSENRN